MRLSLDHQEMITEKLKGLNVVLSEYSFAGLYLFRELHRYEIVGEDNLYIKGITRDQTPFLMPLFIPSPQNLSMIMSQLNKGEIVFPISEEWLSPFRDQSFEFSYHEADSDYLFHIGKLAHYPGRHLSKKRNLVKQLLEEHGVTGEDLNEGNVEMALDILKTWQSESPQKESDYANCAEGLRLFNQLKLQGKIYFVDKEPAAFIMGEWIQSTYFLVHFEKALGPCKGLYQYMLQNFAQSLGKEEGWINLEQDLGIQSLRQAKHSYQPDRMGLKMRIAITS